MGNQGSQLTDEPTAIAQKNLQHFDHSFKAELHAVSGVYFSDVFGEFSGAKRPITVVCKANSMDILEDVGISARKHQDIIFSGITGISWDHATSQVKITVTQSQEEHYVIVTLTNSVEFEAELKLRLSAAASNNRGMKIPSPMYIGMFAGATKPKPFQRKRPNLSHLPNGKLPNLADMRNMAIELHRGSYRPCPPGESRRLEIAMQHIYEGQNTFQLLNVRGIPAIANSFRSESVLVITDDALVFKPRGKDSDMREELFYQDVAEWNAVDNDTMRMNDSGIEIILAANHEKVFFGVEHIRDVKHTLEYFWNTYKVSNGSPNEIKLGSTHGRPIVSVQTLSGETSPPEHNTGQCEVVDQDGMLVRPGGKIALRRSSIAAGVINTTKEPKNVPSENRDVKKHWHKVVLHQGWLLKQGGVGVGQNKAWIKRYFVLYKTSQGHFLVYYSDFTECPMYTSEKNHRNIVDLAKATFIRPGSNKQDNPDTPPYCFDIVTTEREWTLCAESQENAQRWLKLLTRAVDEDVAILPDEELLFKVKPKLDPLQTLPSADYSTTLKVSANGVSVWAPDANNKDSSEREFYFWVYTDFYKWSLMCPDGKFALLINVFCDSSFSRRHEYVFRTKEAHRLATAIEYFIEKFMSVMHIRLETTEGAFDEVPEEQTQVTGDRGGKVGLHQLTAEDIASMQHQEIDLLDMDTDMTGNSSPMRPGGAATANTLPSDNAAIFAADPFGDDPFGEAPPRNAPAPAVSTIVDPFGADPFAEPPARPSTKPVTIADPFGSDPFAPVPTAPTNTRVIPPVPPQKTAANSVLDLFGEVSAPVVVNTKPTAQTVDLFGDPFSNDPFSSPSLANISLNAPAAPKIAPPLTSAQQAQHKQWYASAFGSNGGPIYSDGSLQIGTRIEIRGSQCRVSLSLSNQSPASLNDLKVELKDSAGLLRFEMAPCPQNLSGLGSGSVTIMMECMKPVFPGPQLSVSYTDSLHGQRSNIIDFPILVTSFGEPLTLTAEDFMARWQQLTGAGQETTQILRPPYSIVPPQIHAALTSTMKFGRVFGLPDATDYVVYGAASLRTGAKTSSGEKINVGCLVKIEMNIQANAVRVTLRSLHPAATSAMMDSVKSLLS